MSDLAASSADNPFHLIVWGLDEEERDELASEVLSHIERRVPHSVLSLDSLREDPGSVAEQINRHSVLNLVCFLSVDVEAILTEQYVVSLAAAMASHPAKPAIAVLSCLQEYGSRFAARGIEVKIIDTYKEIAEAILAQNQSNAT